MKPCKLSAKQKEKVLSSFSPDTRHYRLIKVLADKPRRTAQELHSTCSASNISDLALKHNPELRKFGLAIGCHQPPVSYLNKFMQPTGMNEWALYKLSPQELNLPTKGPDRPKAIDPLFKKRQKLVVDLVKQGVFLNEALDKTRNEDFVKNYR